MSCLWNIPKEERNCRFCSAICDERPEEPKSVATTQAKIMAFKDGKQIDLGVCNVREPLRVKNKTAKPISFECEFAMSKEMRKLREDMEQMQRAAMMEFGKKVNAAIEFILRNHVTPPIKGEITKGKVRWRGLQVVWRDTENGRAFIGVRQRDTLITLDGKNIPFPSSMTTTK